MWGLAGKATFPWPWAWAQLEWLLCLWLWLVVSINSVILLFLTCVNWLSESPCCLYSHVSNIFMLNIHNMKGHECHGIPSSNEVNWVCYSRENGILWMLDYRFKITALISILMQELILYFHKSMKLGNFKCFINDSWFKYLNCLDGNNIIQTF